MLSYTKVVILCYSSNLTGSRFQFVIMVMIFRDDRNIFSILSYIS